MVWLRSALGVAILAWLMATTLFPPQLAADLKGQIAVITGGSRGVGRGFLLGLSEAGATVYITGRSKQPLEEACALAPGPGKCIPKVVDNANDTSLEAFFMDLVRETNGQLDILVNNAYSAVGYWGRNKLLGKPFWEQPMELFDQVHNVGVRSHYLASRLAVPIMLKQKRGLIVNTNSPGCLTYMFHVAYGMGKCSVDKMTGDMAMELGPDNVDVISWWAGAPTQTEEVGQGSIDGVSPRRGIPPGPQFPDFSTMVHTGLASTLLYEGRSLAALARDLRRGRHSGLAVQSQRNGREFGVRDERGIQSPNALSVKAMLAMFIPPLFEFTKMKNPPSLQGPPTASQAQQFFFNTVPDINIPVWLLKLLGGAPLTMQWPAS